MLQKYNKILLLSSIVFIFTLILTQLSFSFISHIQPLSGSFSTFVSKLGRWRYNIYNPLLLFLSLISIVKLYILGRRDVGDLIIIITSVCFYGLHILGMLLSLMFKDIRNAYAINDYFLFIAYLGLAIGTLMNLLQATKMMKVELYFQVFMFVGVVSGVLNHLIFIITDITGNWDFYSTFASFNDLYFWYHYHFILIYIVCIGMLYQHIKRLDTGGNHHEA